MQPPSWAGTHMEYFTFSLVFRVPGQNDHQKWVMTCFIYVAQSWKDSIQCEILITSIFGDKLNNEDGLRDAPPYLSEQAQTEAAAVRRISNTKLVFELDLNLDILLLITAVVHLIRTILWIDFISPFCQCATTIKMAIYQQGICRILLANPDRHQYTEYYRTTT